MSTATVETVLGQVEQLSFEEKLLLLEKIAYAMRTEQKNRIASKEAYYGITSGNGVDGGGFR
jgi:hypothetical protein